MVYKFYCMKERDYGLTDNFIGYTVAKNKFNAYERVAKHDRGFFCICVTKVSNLYIFRYLFVKIKNKFFKNIKEISI